MRTIPKWVNKIHESDKTGFSCIHSLCFDPDGTQLVVGAGKKVMVYDPRDGALLQLLQAHKGAVHAVAYCSDGKKFASGSADKNVIIWTSKMEGLLKYSHSEAIQCLAYNSVTLYLASCGISDFAFWSPDVRAVQKYRITGRITSCAWSTNGQHLAIGLTSGVVSIREKTGDEVQVINRNAPVWALTFFKSTLLVTDWDETLSFYNLQGQQTCKERNIGLAAVSLCVLGSVVVAGGAGGWVALTTEGVPVVSMPHDWVWAVAPLPASNTLVMGCQDGTLWCYQAVFSTVHGLYGERYAYRENMTDVIVQHLTTGNKVRIKCHDRIHKIAIYKHRLAVQLPERVVVYEQGDVEGMLYRVREKLSQKSECLLLIANSDALLLCQDTELTMIGKRSPTSWSVPAPIRYVKVTTFCFEEVLLLGLLNGQIWQVEPRSGGAQLVLSTPAGVRCLDVSAARGRVAVVDEASVCRVYSLPKGELLYTEENVSSVSWNAWCDELLCLSGAGLLSVRAGHFPPATQPLAGSVVGFQGGRVFSLQANSMQTVNLPLSHAVHQYVQQKMFSEAYTVACLGVTARDWERLGEAALDDLSLEVARNAFHRRHQLAFLTLIDHLQERLESGELRAVALGEVLAMRGRPTDAARTFRATGRDGRALALYLDLRMFNKAQELADEEESVAVLAQIRAKWARHVSEPRAAANMYLAAGDVRRAADLMASCGRIEMLIELARKLDKGSNEMLRHVAEALVTAGGPAAAADVYQRLGDYKRVASLAVAAGEWSRAFALARDHEECRGIVYLPYAHRMVQENKFVEAQKAYHMAGETATAIRVLNILVANAVAAERFSDASYLHHLLATQCHEMAERAPDKREIYAAEGVENAQLARIYHAYEAVHRCVHEPFSLGQPEALLNSARFALALLEQRTPPPGVSLFCIYLCIAKQAKTLNAAFLACQMLDKILGLQIPQKFQESVDLLMVLTRGAVDKSQHNEVAALCWRCRRHSPTLVALCCPYCHHRLVHSLASHEVLPLVELAPAEGISWEEALALVERAPAPEPDVMSDGADVYQINHFDDSGSLPNNVDEDEDTGVVVCSRNALACLSPATVVVTPTRLYNNMLPELSVMPCTYCRNLFYTEDYETQVLTKTHCQFCRQPTEVRADHEESAEQLNEFRDSSTISENW